ncbi:PQQ-binding-like beta-propeller repeat protein [Kribbella sp. NPDC056951]|uniref:outer membrane protein assembly factor BamB family protein n=1 Tax=Kribbella sp. NPDC056951 TaxID=3345978 RepID=UPI0036309686
MNRLTATFGCLVTALALAGCAAEKPVATPPTPTPSTPSPTPSVPTTPSEPQRPAAWTAALPGAGEFENATVLGETVVVHGRKLVAGLNRADGKVLWKVPVSGEVRVSVTKAVVLIEQVSLFQGVDIRSGKVKYRKKHAAGRQNAGITADWVVVPDCAGRTCRVRGLQLPSFKERWHADFPIGTTPNVDAPGSDVTAHYYSLGEPNLVRPAPYVVFGRDTGKERLMTALATATGRPGKTFEAWDQYLTLTTGRLGLMWDERFSGGAIRISGHDVLTGRYLWQQRGWRWDNGGQAGYPALTSRLLAVPTKEKTVALIDLTTGKVRWTSRVKGIPVGLTDRTLLIQVGEFSNEIDLVGLDTANGNQRWQIELPRTMLAGRDQAVAVVGDRVAHEIAGPAVRVNDVRTGNALWSAEGSADLLGLGPDWLITQSAGADDRIQFFK